MNSLLLRPKILLQQLNVLLIELNILVLLQNIFVIPILTNDFLGMTKPFFRGVNRTDITQSNPSTSTRGTLIKPTSKTQPNFT